MQRIAWEYAEGRAIAPLLKGKTVTFVLPEKQWEALRREVWRQFQERVAGEYDGSEPPEKERGLVAFGMRRAVEYYLARCSGKRAVLALPKAEPMSLQSAEQILDEALGDLASAEPDPEWERWNAPVVREEA